MPGTLKERVERWAGDQFVAWFNDRNATQYAFQRHASPPEADLIYSDGNAILSVEVTGAGLTPDSLDTLGLFFSVPVLQGCKASEG